jgi:hypothetical protein
MTDTTLARTSQRVATRALCITTLAALAACSSDPSPPASGAESPDWQGTIEERAGVVHVRNPNAALWGDAASSPIRFEPDGVFGGPGAQISSIAGAVVDRDGNLHVYDALQSELVALSEDGAVLWRRGERGDGVDQFDGVRGIAYDGAELVYVVNQNGTRLDAWGIDGDHRRSLSIGGLGLERVYMGGFLTTHRIALLTDAVHNMATNEYVIVDLDGEPTVDARFSIGAQPVVPIPPGVVLQLSHYFHDNQILVGTWEQYVLRVYDAGGALRRRVTRPVDYLRRPGFAIADEQYLGVALGGLAAPIVLPSGHWLVLAAWPTNVDDPNGFAEMPAADRPEIAWASSLDLFDADGRFLYSLQTTGSQSPEIGRPWAVGPRGRLYTVTADPFPQVRRYRIVLDPPATN